MSTQWLRALDCPLLQGAANVDAGALRLVQRLLEIALAQQSTGTLAQALLGEIAGQLRADHVGIWEATPSWQLRWHFARPATRVNLEAVPRPLLNEILDRQAGVSKPLTDQVPALLGACLSFVDRPNRLLLALRPREPFSRADLEYAVAAGHYV
ncbi:MAG TPA: hypothetical protein VNX28_17830, partial [Gemmataceae bacterium]|nr:hypothetical protein [Gemmataceae bacterium]